MIFTGARNTVLDATALAARGIPVSHKEWGPSKESTCELTWTLILAASKRLEANFEVMRAGGWRDDQPLPSVLAGEQLGLIGLGEIGGRVARVAGAFGMQVVAWSPRMTAERATEKGATAVSLEELLSMSRVIGLHLVPTDQTRGLINAERLARMRDDSILVNTSRSALIDMSSLLAALREGRPAMAALDVYDEEPLAPEHPLRSIKERRADSAHRLRIAAGLRSVCARRHGMPAGVASRCAAGTTVDDPLADARFCARRRGLHRAPRRCSAAPQEA